MNLLIITLIIIYDFNTDFKTRAKAFHIIKIKMIYFDILRIVRL